MTKLSNARYKICHSLGKGGYGEVFLAWDKKLHRQVAIKFMHNSNINIIEEALALAKINHQNIVTLFDIIDWQNEMAIVMEYVESAEIMTLESLKLYDKSRFLDFIISVANGVAAIHKESMYHGDIKLGNILINTYGKVKVTDFGLSSFCPSKKPENTSPERLIGSWECLAPEQLLNNTTTTASDIFSLGVLLYYWLYKKHPFIGNNTSETKNNLLNKISFQKKTMSQENIKLFVLCKKMLEKKPKHRPDIQAIIHELKLIKTEQEIINSGQLIIETTEIQNNVLSRNKLLMTSSISLLILMFLILLYGKWKNSEIKSILVVPTKISSPQLQENHIKNELLVEKNKNLSVIINDELTDAVLTNSKSLLIPKREWKGDRSWTRVANSLQIDEILFSELFCHTTTSCQVKIAIYSSQEKKITQSQTLELPTSNLLLFAEIIRNITDEILTNDSKPLVKTINESTFEQYIKIKANHDSHSLEEQISLLENLEKTNKNFTPIYLQLGLFYLRNFEITQNKKWLKKAYDCVEKINISNSSLELLFWIQIYSEDFDAAENTLNLLSELPMIDLSFLVLRKATLTAAKGEALEALNYLKEYPKIRKNNHYFYVNAYILDLLGRYENLLTLTSQWLTLIDSSVAMEYRLIAFIHLGKLSEAIKLGNSLEFYKESHTVLDNLGIAYLLNQNFSESIKIFQYLYISQPENRKLLFNLGDAYLAKKNLAKSQEYYQLFINKTLALSEKTWRDHAYLALAHAHLEQETEALLALQYMSAQALAADAASTGMYYLLSAQIYALINQHNAALVNGLKALERNQKIHWLNMPWFEKLQDDLQKITK